GRAVDADARGNDPVRCAGLADEVPQLGAALHRDVELPTELADVRDAGRQDVERAELDRAARAELERLVADVALGEVAEDVARPRAPQADRRVCRRLVDDLRRPVRGHVVAEPLAVEVAVRAAGT